jgi:RHS repeat-associated protein
MAETVLAMGSSGERTVRSYPLYDGHGNTVGQVARAEDGSPDASFAPVPGAPAFELGARRKYDAWGQVRWSEGSPLDQGYCGSLQHRRDAESGLVYMRARYYEPWTGRFLSEDPAMDGANWYAYCANDPVNYNDPSGKVVEQAVVGILKFLLGLFISGEIEAVLNRIDRLTRYMAQLDSLIEDSVNKGCSLQWPEAQQRRIRDRVRILLKELNALKTKERLIRVGSGVGKAIDKLLGYSLIISALIIDVDLGPNGVGSLEGIFGN